MNQNINSPWVVSEPLERPEDRYNKSWEACLKYSGAFTVLDKSVLD